MTLDREKAFKIFKNSSFILYSWLKIDFVSSQIFSCNYKAEKILLNKKNCKNMPTIIAIII